MIPCYNAHISPFLRVYADAILSKQNIRGWISYKTWSNESTDNTSHMCETKKIQVNTNMADKRKVRSLNWSNRDKAMTDKEDEVEGCPYILKRFVLVA